MGKVIVIGILITLVICYIRFVLKVRRKEKERIKAEIKKKEDLISDITKNVEESGLDIIEWNTIKHELNNYNFEYIKNLEKKIDRIVKISLKYKDVITDDKLNSLISYNYFIGMTEEMCIDSVGKPNKIEDEIQKTKTKRTYIYGNKSSGDVLVFENGILVRFKDR